MTYKFTKWTWGGDIREDDLRSDMRAEGLAPYTWRNGPDFQYSAHTHSYTKILTVVSGSITFHLSETEDVFMEPGDRLELPARTLHAATVGPEGVICLEAAKRD
jgi:mannose-6-phosphate isomerase-like protein (cupin superfamily)